MSSRCLLIITHGAHPERIGICLVIISFFFFQMTACSSEPAKEQPVVSPMTDNHLAPCPSSPNCVCSEYPDRDAFIQPVKFQGNPAGAWEKAATIVEGMGGVIMQEKENYLHVTFTSRLFRFVDDLELRLDEKEGVIHLRSASRTGFYDFGVNRKRVERFRELFRETPRDG